MAYVSKLTDTGGTSYDIRSYKSAAIPYGVVNGTSTSTAYTATVDGITALYDGVTVLLKNGVVTSAAGFTININGLGAKPVYSNMASASAETTIFNVNYTMLFVYDSTRVAGGAWICYRGYYDESGGSGGVLMVTYTVDPDTGEITGADYTAQEIVEAVEDGMYVVANFIGLIIPLFGAEEDGGEYYVDFSSTSFSGSSVSGFHLSHSSEDGETYYFVDEYKTIPNTSTMYGTSSTTATTATKTCSISNFRLDTGSVLCITFTNGNTYTSGAIMLKVNTFSAVNIYVNNAVTSSTNTLTWDAGETLTFVYTGTRYEFVAKSKFPEPATVNPLVDGTAAVGSSSKYALEDHVHPTDTSRQETLTSGTNIKTINNESILGSGNLTVTGSTTTWYGTSSTTASTANKEVSCTGYTLVKGSIITVLFTTNNTAETPKLNVNSTGALSIYIGDSTPSGTSNTLKWNANTVIMFVYDGSAYRYIMARCSAPNTPPDGAGSWYGTSSDSASGYGKTCTISNYRLMPGARVSITFTNANTCTSPLQLNVSSTGSKSIYYNNAATSSTNTLLWDAGETLTFVYDGSYYHLVCRSNAGSPTPMTDAEVDAAVQAGWGTALNNADNIEY